MNTELFERIKKKGQQRKAAEVKASLEEMKSGRVVPLERMEYFYTTAEKYLTGNVPSLIRKKIIATTCIHVPVELIYAVDAVPIRICSGSYQSDQTGGELLPAKTCPLIKSTMGDLLYGLLPGGLQPHLVVHPSTCDQKTKMGLFADDTRLDFFLLEVPSSKESEEARDYWHQVVKKFARKLEVVTGKRITRNRLREAILMVAKAQEQFRRFQKLRNKTCVISGPEALLITNTWFYDDIQSWTTHLKALNDELDTLEDTNNKLDKPKLLITGSPNIFPEMKVPVLVEKLGGFIMADEFCSGARMLHDTVAVDEWWLYDMIPALADRYLKPSACPNFHPNDDRIRKILSDIDALGIDGVVYQVFTGCQLYDLEARRTGKLLDEKGIPVLFIETDYNPDDFGQLTTRVEAFLETLKYNS